MLGRFKIKRIPFYVGLLLRPLYLIAISFPTKTRSTLRKNFVVFAALWERRQCLVAIITVLIIQVAFVSCNTASQKSTWQLVWSDEFNYTGLPDTSKWNYDIGSNDGWGNNELQYYTYKKMENARVENGNLVIEARKEKKDSFNYTSARLLTKEKASWQYGKIEVRAK
ncbi:MAG: glycoside hydrolase family 16 protein, partial [Ferruginibacter sp.]